MNFKFIFFIIMIGVIVFLVYMFGNRMRGSEANNFPGGISTSTLATTTIENTNVLNPHDQTNIKNALEDYSGIGNLTVNVDKIIGSYASGILYSGNNVGSQQLWIASRMNSGWQIIYSGSQIPRCTVVSPYFLPFQILSGCIDDEGNFRSLIDENIYDLLIKILDEIDEQSITINSAKLNWTVGEQELVLEGYGFVINNLSVDKIDKVRSFLKEEGFKENIQNKISGTEGWEKDGLICKIRKSLEEEGEQTEIKCSKIN